MICSVIGSFRERTGRSRLQREDAALGKSDARFARFPSKLTAQPNFRWAQEHGKGPHVVDASDHESLSASIASICDARRAGR